jgi:hypothetical protein
MIPQNKFSFLFHSKRCVPILRRTLRYIVHIPFRRIGTHLCESGGTIDMRRRRKRGMREKFGGDVTR